MRKLFASEWISLDGVFDAGNMDKWFNPYHSDERAAYLQNVIHSTEAVIFGRTTYEMLMPYWSSLKNNEMGIADKLNTMPKYVVSSTLKTVEWNNSHLISSNAIEQIKQLKAQSSGDIHIEGSGTLVNALIDAGVLDELWLLVNPVIMNSGKRLFRDGADTSKLELIEAKPISLGVVILRYKIAHE